MWLPQSYGRDPGEIAAAAGMSVRAGHPVTAQRNQLADAIAKIAPGVMAYLKQKKQDAIANELMNMEQPPRAESVDPSLQGAPATQPFTGGQQGYQAHQMYQKYLNDQQDRQNANTPDTAMDDLQYQHAYRLAHPEEFPDKPNGPQYVNTPNGRMTAHEASVIQRDQNKANARGVGGLTLDQLNQPGYVRYEDKDGNVRSNEEAQADPEGTFAVPPGAKQRTPYTQWNSAADLFRKAQGRANPSAAQPADAQKPTGMTKADYDAMPSGTVYTAPDGTQRVKK